MVQESDISQLRTKKLNRNTIGSLAVKCSTMLIEVIKVSILLSYLSVEKYGVWLTIVSIVLWSHHFDLGLGTGLKFKLTEAIANGNLKRSKHLVSTAYISIIVIMGGVFLILLPVIYSTNWCEIFNTEISNREIQTSILCILISFIGQFIFELVTIVLKAYQRTAISEAFKPIGNAISLCVVIVLGWFSHDSLILASISMTAPYVIVLIIANIYYFTRTYRNICPNISYARTGYLKDIYSLGFKFFINQLSAAVVFTTANVLLSNIINPTEVSIYNTANTYYNIVVIFFTAIIVAASTPITDAYVRQDYNWIKNRMAKLRMIAMLGIAAEIILFFISDFTFHIWVGDRVIVPTSLAIIFVGYNILALFSQQYNLFLASVGKMNLTVIISCIKIVVFIPIAVVMIRAYGGIGLISSIIAINTIPNLVFGYIQTNKIISGTATGIWNK